jgi:UDP-N-acetylmuramoyl-tripeptide--D-alanyl-D-alanine ligase
MTLWNSRDAAAATGGRVTRDWSATGISIDTRTLVPGDLFVALTAARDGHDFVAEALDKGAAAALVSHVPAGVPETAPLLVVADVQSALEALGRAGRARTGARVVAVTGSAGKTSTKEMVRHVLSAQGRTHAAEASYNNHWGVPLTLARMPADAEFAVIEIGMNRPGEIAPLARMARPDVAIVTTVAPAHLEAFDDIGGIAREKASIFEGLGPGGSAVFNADLDQTPILARAATATGAQAVRFGRSANRYRLVSAQLAGEKTVVEAALNGDRVLFKLGTPGRHFAMNGLAVLAAVEA